MYFESFSLASLSDFAESVLFSLVLVLALLSDFVESALLVLFATVFVSDFAESALFALAPVSALLLVLALFVFVELAFLSLDFSSSDFSLSNSDSQKTRVSPSNLKSSLSKSRSRLMASFAPLGISTPSFLG